MEWEVLKPDVYANMMDFFASNQPVVTAEEPKEESKSAAEEGKGARPNPTQS